NQNQNPQPVYNQNQNPQPVYNQNQNPQPMFAPNSASGTVSADDILGTIERLARLRENGILSEQEFTAKKAELLSRL
ncbi:MAG TPA: SHOCT domain-containing protein, partial [Candidatus Competibacteraceae bacterium]|nr:SHOCT domain-containing protein [Candidatus Competibacteraceae bacterium]